MAEVGTSDPHEARGRPRTGVGLPTPTTRLPGIPSVRNPAVHRSGFSDIIRKKFSTAFGPWPIEAAVHYRPNCPWTKNIMTSTITSDPAIMLGKPVIAGTRITVELILEKVAAGESIDDLLLDYPQLSREAVFAALRFALQVLRNDVVYPRGGQVA